AEVSLPASGVAVPGGSVGTRSAALRAGASAVFAAGLRARRAGGVVVPSGFAVVVACAGAAASDAGGVRRVRGFDGVASVALAAGARLRGAFGRSFSSMREV